jgi:hypothetical protein
MLNCQTLKTVATGFLHREKRRKLLAPVGIVDRVTAVVISIEGVLVTGHAPLGALYMHPS